MDHATLSDDGITQSAMVLTGMFDQKDIGAMNLGTCMGARQILHSIYPGVFQ